MNSWIPALLVAAAGATFTGPASATVLTFDDLGADGFVPATYGGLDWSAADWFAFGDAQDPYAPHSGDYRVAAGFGDPDSATTIGLGARSTFEGAWFSGLRGATVTFVMFYGGALVATSTTLDPDATSRFLASGYTGFVDRVVVASPAQGSYAMDDFTFAAVPEPQTAALALAGFCAIGVFRRRTAARSR